MSDTRLTLAIPQDVAKMFDSRVTQTQIDNNTFLSSTDDADTLAAMIEDAEDEFRRMADVDTRISREGVPGNRETYEEITYDTPGHQQFKEAWTGVRSNYAATSRTTGLDNDHVMPFDPDAGDQAFAFRGLSRTGDAGWEDITDEYGDTWAIVNNREGELMLSPIEIWRAMKQTNQGVSFGGASRLEELRFAITYRHGQLDRTRDRMANTALDAGIDDSETGAVDVADAKTLPSGVAGPTQVLLIGREYVTATLDRDNGQIVLTERGVRGTTAASHDSGDRVQYTPPSMRKAVASRAGAKLINSSTYRGYMPNTDADVEPSDILEDLDETWNDTIEALS